MRGEIVYRIYGVHAGRKDDVYFGAFRTRAEAEAEVAKLNAREMHGSNWAAKYHDQGFVIRTATVETDFEFPSLPKPRDKYVVSVTAKPNAPGEWPSALVQVSRRADGVLEPVCEYERNHALFDTFEPFRQGTRELALISRDYTKTAVLDLATGQVIAEEEDEYLDAERTQLVEGFCPVGFYVPDWWDLHDDSIIPGSEYWNADNEWPTGDFGFVWGGIWGDDRSWKVQHLDLSRVQQGVIKREERFGYLELVTHGFDPPWAKPELPPFGTASKPPPFIQVSRHGGKVRVRFSVQLEFDGTTGEMNEEHRDNLLAAMNRRST